MGAGLAKVAVVKFAALPGNQYKVLVYMCFHVLDEPGKPQDRWRDIFPDGRHPARFWWRGWESLALAMGRSIPDDPSARRNLRDEVGRVCRALVKAGAIERRGHPTNAKENAFHVAVSLGGSQGDSPCDPVDGSQGDSSADHRANHPAKSGGSQGDSSADHRANHPAKHALRNNKEQLLRTHLKEADSDVCTPVTDRAPEAADDNESSPTRDKTIADLRRQLSEATGGVAS